MNQEFRATHEEVSKCNRCGFCQAHCPIFDITRDERSVARGHNVHVRKLLEGDLEINEDFKDPLFECLLCRSCVSNCFPAVQTDRNVIAGRAEYLKKVGQPGAMRFLFHQLLPDHAELARYVKLAALGKNSGMGALARAMGILQWFGQDLDEAEGIIESLPTSFFRERVDGLNLEPARADATVGYFVGCGFNFVLPHVSEDTVDVLVHAGARVRIADNCCCGLPAYGHGDLEAARRMARKNVEALERLDAELIVTECGSCSAFLKEYPALFEDEPAMRGRAERLSKRVRGFSEFLTGRLPESGDVPGPSGRVTYHDPCHLSRYQGVVREPRALLQRVSTLTYVELPDADRCCGAAGSYNVLHYEQSMKVLERKMESVKRTGADLLTTECPGCLIQLGYGVRRAGLDVRVAHLSQVLREAYLGRRPRDVERPGGDGGAWSEGNAGGGLGDLWSY
ncbi:MAG: (Fe-S)-binding protein [Deltaproteobacteria bacterium]|nr:(Fe-S)-binding protein [Deltaproteobacteria bacterium]